MADDTTTERQTLTLVRDRTNAGTVQPAETPTAGSEVKGGLVQPGPAPSVAEPVEVPPVPDAPAEPKVVEPIAKPVDEPTSFVDVLGSDQIEPVADPEPAVGSAPGPAPAEPVQVGPLEFFGRAKRGRTFRR